MKKVLIIENNVTNLYLMTKILQKAGYTIIETHDDAIGVELAIIEKPNIILLDIQLPVLNGYNTIKKLRENELTKDVIIINVSSYAVEGAREKALLAGCDDYIEKPIEPQFFIDIIKKY